jgi:hypothetical protein
MNIKIETYKNVDIFYNKNNGRLLFEFENREFEVKYLFEAKQIIDEPVWEECNLEGYFIDGTWDDYLGKAKALKKDIKSGIPYWLFKGKFDFEWKYPQSFDKHRVFPKNKINDEIYNEWKIQADKEMTEHRKTIDIIKKLKVL